MLRLLWAAFALACGVALAYAASPAPPDNSGSAPMRFEWRQEGPADICGANCRVWISAVGYITADTPREFEAFAKDPKVRGAVLVLDSDGGSVLGTLALGRMIRSLDMITTIGKSTSLPRAAGRDARATLSPNGNCESMCAFLLLAGTQPLRAAAGAGARSPDLARQEAQAGAGVQLFRRGAQHRAARHRAAGAIHDRDGRRRRSAGDRLAHSAMGAAVPALRRRASAHAAHHRRCAVRAASSRAPRRRRRRWRPSVSRAPSAIDCEGVRVAK